MIKDDIIVYQKAFEEIKNNEDSDKKKIAEYRAIFIVIAEIFTEDSKINFTTFFSRLSFLCSQNQFEGKYTFLLHQLRRIAEGKSKSDFSKTEILSLYEYCLASLFAFFIEGTMPTAKQFVDINVFSKSVKEEKKKFKSVVNALLVDINLENYQLSFLDDDGGDDAKIAQFDLFHQNEIFSKNIVNIEKYFQLPIHVNLIDCEITNDNIYEPKALVIDPDFLVDVTAIASVFTDKGAVSLLYPLSKFKLRESSMALLVGNIANYILDDLITDPSLKFSDFISTLFSREALSLAIYTDKEVRQLIAKLEIHFNNLANTINQQFPKVELNPEEVYLEPSFYSRDYGIQGRLDLLKYDDNENHINIVELKSGKPFKPNVYSINQGHYTQTLLYELLIKSSFEGQRKANSFILYSSLSEKSLKHAPVVKTEQYEAIKTRNDIIIIEQMMSSKDTIEQIFELLKLQYLPNILGFSKTDLVNFEKVYQSLDEVLKPYFICFASFIAKEFQISKTGQHGLMNQPGHAGLWLLSDEEKEERYIILKSLQIVENQTENEDPILILKRTEKTNDLANFRVGDIIVLYPTKDTYKTKENNQIFKAVITQISDENIEVRLRSKQSNQKIFLHNDYWNIEEDSLDGSFNTMYRSLYEFIQVPQAKKELLLGITKPNEGNFDPDFKPVDELTAEQNNYLKNIIAANDYYLLWGPPGTGKTSMMIKHLVSHYHSKQSNILLLAYTNRAVDEICEAVKAIKSDAYAKSIRIGSKFSTGEDFQDILLNHKIGNTSSRKELMYVIDNANITIATLSSILGKHEIFELKKFDIVIIDEASQILEPMLIGLLSKVKKFVLIGDHKQLPAIVIQDKDQTKIENEKLVELGFESTSVSLFERMYRQLTLLNNSTNIGYLSLQGRMHEQIMGFVNNHFYENKLVTIPFIERLKEPTYSTSQNQLLNNRTIFINTKIEEGLNWKTNIFEAKTIAKILTQIIAYYKAQNKDLSLNSIGVITLYRAQIACIKHEIQHIVSSVREKISIDTVERYQGSARDIIILSLCTNKLGQLKSIVSLSEDGTDRKLNVALTRAKEQLIVLGNKNILSQNKVYKDLINTFSNVDSELV
jgi:DNA replication ATP-dependent helicase Dna2